MNFNSKNLVYLIIHKTNKNRGTTKTDRATMLRVYLETH